MTRGHARHRDRGFTLLEVLVSLLILLATMSVITTLKICRRLQANHDETWSLLGRPMLPLTVKSQIDFLRFLWSSRHRGLQDRDLTVWVWVDRLLMTSGIALLVGGWVVSLM